MEVHNHQVVHKLLEEHTHQVVYNLLVIPSFIQDVLRGYLSYLMKVDKGIRVLHKIISELDFQSFLLLEYH